ncbi:ATP phosphoribosyltransferase regulatory subunit [Chloracidobacterium sp. D]|uniref:ATP phosphoribosyltransferase regulatory subunit n=1 Tax=Chloracidobacterium sp. D TaxID=2821536 RepID=UPI001B8D331D|nr:ATP phosphoribosyltransferase regulatory subunit [Chloracidobacterium sp. D]QUV81289.1 ATP phosphoribosyltransferase regulatory subunit [Chloracidobacterium sp. D]
MTTIMDTWFKLPAGVTYVLGPEVRRRRTIERIVFETFHGWSYEEILLPVYDAYALFAQSTGSHPAEATYCFTDVEGELLALRPDLTSLVARTVATRCRDWPRPIRLCYGGEVFRNTHAARRVASATWQLGAELFGNDRLEADVEVLLVALEALERLGLEEVQVLLGHAGILAGVAEELELSAGQRETLRQLIDRRQYAALETWLREQSAPALWRDLLSVHGQSAALHHLRAQTRNDHILAALDDLEHVFDVASALGIADRLTFDASAVGRLGYYTGMTFHIYVPGSGLAVGSGGRYDALTRLFGVDEPAVGFQLSLDQLIRVLPTLSVSMPRTTALDADGDDLTAAFRHARQCRRAGERVEIRTARHSSPPER